MPLSNITDITIVLDRSGSMEAIAKQTIAGFNQFLHEQRQQPGSACISLVQFDDRYETVHAAVPLAKAAKLRRKTFVPRGSTALLDAMGIAIDATGGRLAEMPEAQRPEQVLFVTITDGMENASQKYTHHQVADMIAHQRERYGWGFVFLGANQDAIATAAALRMDGGSSLSYSVEGDAPALAWKNLSRATSRSCRTRGQCEVSFTAEERVESSDGSSAR